MHATLLRLRCAPGQATEVARLINAEYVPRFAEVEGVGYDLVRLEIVRSKTILRQIELGVMGEGAGGDRVDAVDVIIDQWRRERPDLDLSAMGVFGRIALLTAVLGPAVEQVLERHGLRRGEFDVLTALRRSGPPYTLIPSKLSAALMMSRAGMTSRLDRLEEAGLVERRLDPDDRRSFLVTLTGRGRAVIDATLTEHAANLARLISPLTPEETRTLERALKTLLLGATTAAGA